MSDIKQKRTKFNKQTFIHYPIVNKYCEHHKRKLDRYLSMKCKEHETPSMQFSCLLDFQAPVWGKSIQGTSSAAKGFFSQNRLQDHFASTACSSNMTHTAHSSILQPHLTATSYPLQVISTAGIIDLEFELFPCKFHSSLTFFIVTVLVRIIVSILSGVLSS